MKRTFVLTTSLVCFLGGLPDAARAVSFSELYVFGDSLSDTGNLFELTGGSTPPSPPYFQGRFSNGPVWVEYLADDLELPCNPSTNFAFGGATASGGTPVPDLLEQVALFQGALGGGSADPNALYIVWAGANDYNRGGVSNPTVPVGGIADAIATLAGLGAQQFLVGNLPDLGALPEARLRPGVTPEELNLLTQAHNQTLANTLGDLNRNPGIDATLLDINALFREVSARPSEFGFTNTTDACLGPTGLCDKPENFLFWDGVHPTTTAHETVAHFAGDTLGVRKSTPEPGVLLGLSAVAVGGVCGRVARRRK